MIALQALSAITVFFVLSGLVLFGITIWTLATRRDELYQTKYQRFLEQRRRVTDKLRNARK